MRFYKFLVYIFIISILILSTFNYESYSYSKSILQNNFYTMDKDYIYKLSSNGVEIIKINKFKNMRRENLIKEELLNGKIHIFKDKLFISGIKNENNNSYLNVIVYDIYDKKNPIKLSEVTVDGNDYLLKEKDGVLYLLSKGTNEKINIVSVDLNKEKISLRTHEFSGNEVDFMYLSPENLYILCRDDVLDKKSTILHKLHIDRDILTYVDKISFNGFVLNESFINEEGNFLRILSLEDNQNKMYIFNNGLKIEKSIDINSEGSNINTVYFDGDICYISTFMKNSNLYIYDLNINEPREIGKIKNSSSIDHILKLNEEKILLIGNENRIDTYKNLSTNMVYELLKNVGIKITVLDIKDKTSPIIFDEYLIRGKQVYSPLLLNGNNFLYLEDKNVLAIPLDITNYNNDMDVNSAMEVGFNIYGNIISNYEKIFNGVYVFDIDDESGIDLKFIVNNQKEFEKFQYKDTEHINILDDKIFIFTKDCVKVFDFGGVSLGEYTF